MTFSVVAVSSTTLRYKWYFNGKNVGNGYGSATASFTVTNIQPKDAGTYHVEVMNASGTTASSNAVLTVVTQPPTLTLPRITTAGFSFQLTGTIGTTYVIESSTNCVNWVPIYTNTVLLGTVNFTDSSATNRPFTLYRARAL